jgi:hypothetical protein
LAALRKCGSHARACRAVGIARSAAYSLLKADPDFRAAYQGAKEEAADWLEEIARKRAVEGSETLLIFLLKGLRPEKYRGL